MRNNIFIVLGVILVSLAGSWFTSGGMEWYRTIELPAWTPPGSVIGAVWTVLFIFAAISLILAQRKRIFIAAAVNGVLNVFWSVLFFGMHEMGWAAIEAGLLGVSVIVLIRFMWPVSKTAAALLIPYVLWVAFATFLTTTVWQLNMPAVSYQRNFNAMDIQQVVQEVAAGTATLVDVRRDDEWAAGHAAGAIHFELAKLEAGEMPDIPNDAVVYVYCAAGARAGKATELLLANGWTNVTNIGGLDAWRAAGGPVEE